MGNSGILVSTLGIGCWSFGGGSYWGEQAQGDVSTVVHAALDIGINYFDTAQVYNDGASEISLGRALQGRRHEAVIGTKVSPNHAYAQSLREHCEASLRRLDTDYIDLYMLHWPINRVSLRHYDADERILSSPPTVEEAFGTLADLQAEGKIRAIGVSNHGVRQLEQVRALGTKIVANQLAYNLASRAIEHDILPYCVKNDIGIIAYSPLMQGVLTGLYENAESVRPVLARTRHFHQDRGLGSRHGGDGVEEELFDVIGRIRALANAVGVSMTVLSLAWVAQRQGISTAIVGSRNLAQLSVNAKAGEYVLPDDLRNELDCITEPLLQHLGPSADYYESELNSRIF